MVYQDLTKFTTPEGFRGRSAWVVQLWWIVQSTLFNTSPQFLFGWRRFLLRLFGAKIGRGVLVRPSVKVTYPWKVRIGDYSWIGDEVTLYSLGPIVIGNHAVVSQKSYLCTGSHDSRSEAFDIYERAIIVEDEAWIATDVFIAPGVKIGRGAVIGARSTVYKDVEGGYIYSGHPLEKIRKRESRVARQPVTTV